MNFSNTHKPSSTVNLNFTNKLTGIFPKLSLATLFCFFFYITSRCEFWILMSTLKSVHKCKAKPFVNDIIISFIVGILTTNAFLHHLWIMYKMNVTQLFVCHCTSKKMFWYVIFITTLKILESADWKMNTVAWLSSGLSTKER